MVTLTVALEDMKTQLADAVRGALEKGFELVAGVVGAKLAKSMEVAVENAELTGKGLAFGEVSGLRAQIKDNAIILLPLMRARNRISTGGAVDDPETGIRIITTGSASTGGLRSMLVETTSTTKPHLLFWSSKHATAAAAFKDLLDVTQLQLKIYVAALVDPPSPTVDTGEPGWTRMPHPSFHDPVNATATATPAGREGAAKMSSRTRSKLFWDATGTKNPSFESSGGFDYGSFDSGFDSGDDATYVDPAMATKWTI